MLQLPVLEQRAVIDAAIADQTLCTRFVRTAADHADLTAQVWHEEGVWRSRTWGELRAEVEHAALGLDSLGIERGTFAVILGGNVPEHVVSDLGLFHAGLYPVSIYGTTAPDQIQYIVSHSGAAVAIVEDEVALQKILKVRSQLPALEHIILWHGCADGCLQWSDILKAGRARSVASPSAFRELYERVMPDDITQLVYTSGTTGPPKAVIITHRMLLWILESYRYSFEWRPGEHLLSYLPMAHLGERFHTYYPGILFGCTTYFWRDFDTLVDGMLVARPAYIHGTPRVWEKLMARLQVEIDRQPDVANAFSVARANEDIRQAGGEIADLDADAAAAWKLRSVLASVGLASCRGAVVSGAPPGDVLFGFFRSLGLPFGCLYGQTEMGGGVTVAFADHRVGTAGYLIPGVELKLAEDREILVRAPCSTPGYYRDEPGTAGLYDAEGWVQSGDLGSIDDDGALRIVGRKKDILITSGGKNVTPVEIEGLLKGLQFVDQACVIGDARRYLTAVATVDEVAFRAWAALRGRPDAPIEDMVADPKFVEELADAVAAINQQVNRVEQIKRFIITADVWSVEGGQFTPSLKLKRNAITQQYAARIDAMYEETDGVPVPGADRRLEDA